MGGKFAWNWQKPDIEKLLATDDVVIMGGVTSNQTDFYDLFDYVFVMTVSQETLRQRLEQHEHKSHHLLGVIDRKVALLPEKQASMINIPKAIKLDSNRPTFEIARNILQMCYITKFKI